MTQKLNLAEDSNFVLGGKLYAQGLMNFGKGMDEEKKAKIKEHLSL